MTKRKAGPTLGRRYAAVKRHLLRLPQESHGMEVDFCPLPDIVPDEDGFWLGLAVDHDTATILMTAVLDKPPDAEDAAEIVTRAMEFSFFRASSRPRRLLLRDNPTWEALYPWLEQLGIEAVVAEDLLHWDAKAEELIDWMRKHWSPVPELRTEIHEELGIFDTLLDLRILASRFLFFEQPKDK